MDVTITGVGVDAGLIMVADPEYLEKFPHIHPIKSHSAQLVPVSNGRYRVNWRIENTWNGSISGTEELVITSGEIFVSDPCYLIGRDDHDDWMNWLDHTDYGDNVTDNNAFMINEMGGDGCYDVELFLNKVGEVD
jgi:hypothetical protein